MVIEFNHSDTGLNIPQHASHVARAGNDLSVVDESTTRQVTRVSAKFSAASGTLTISGLEVVNRTDIVQATASNEVTGR